jgi:hypothetical protein
MVSSKETSVSSYLSSLPSDRRDAVAAMRALVNRALPKGFEETMQYGMISWIVPLTRFATTYNGQPLAIASLAAQKNHDALYLFGAYGKAGEEKKLAEGFARARKKLDMGKSCLRWKRLEDLALDAVVAALGAVTVEDMIALHEAAHGAKKKARKNSPTTKKTATKKTATKKTPTKKTATKKTATKKTAPTKKAATKTG